MGKIDIIGKYSDKTKNWNYDIQNLKTSLAIADYEPIINNSSQKFDYIIYCYGSRVENHSKDGYNIKPKEAHVNNIIDYFKKTNHNIIVKFIMLDKDTTLKNNSLFLSNYINYLCDNNNCNSINIIGYSKSGVMFFDMMKYINQRNYKKINLYNVATPYLGTKMASPKIIYNDVRRYIENNILDEVLTNKIYNKIVKCYEKLTSDSHIYYDVASANGVPDNKLDKYDPTLIQNIFCDDNLNAISKINRFSNYVTGINDNTLKRAKKTFDIKGIGMCLLDEKLMYRNSDGFVHIVSEEAVSKYFDLENIYIRGAHHDFMGDKLYCNQLLDDIDENINIDKLKTKKLVR